MLVKILKILYRRTSCEISICIDSIYNASVSDKVSRSNSSLGTELWLRVLKDADKELAELMDI